MVTHPLIKTLSGLGRENNLMILDFMPKVHLQNNISNYLGKDCQRRIADL
jgi:hypothetical protein